MTMSDALLRVKELTASYGESKVLHGVSFDVRKGETVALLGRNGAGKTTTLKAIVGLLGNSEGSVQLKGQELLRMPLHGVARLGLGYVPEDRGIFAKLNVMENLLLPPVFAPGGHTVEQLFEMFPNLAERRRSQGTKLSGGEQQMLAIARILRTGPSILVLDEPTEGLAPVIVKMIANALQDLRRQGMTILLVEQNFTFARKVADRFLVMEDGAIIDEFSAAELSGRMEGLKKVLGL
jgi:branched-chain amino acid transport system ATP-binding protein